MKKRKGLVFSWYFPPINSSEGLCTFKLLKNSELTYDVFTQKNINDFSYKTEENKLISSNINVIYENAENCENWIQKGINYGTENIDKYDFIMSRSMEPESHEIALELKRKNKNIIWIASFGDPITNNPYLKLSEKINPYKIKGKGIFNFSIKFTLSPKRIIKSIIWNYRDFNYKRKYTHFYKYKQLQDDTIKECDMIIFNNKYQRDYMLEHYNNNIKAKSVIVPHGYDLDLYEQTQQNKKNKYIISYLGHLDKIRTPKLFLEALKKLKNNRLELYNKLEVNFYGNMDIEDKVLLIDYELYDSVKFKKNVGYLESLKIMKESDLLLLIDANLGTISSNNIFFAAKLADYIGSGSNIFGITMIDGPSCDIIREVNGVVSSHSVEDIYNNLVMILDSKININIMDKEGKYNIKNISKNLDDIIKELCNK